MIGEHQEIHWNARGSCGASGCTDPMCVCSLCGLPIGVAESDWRWEFHPDYCDGCALCEDSIPWIIFRGEGRNMKQAQFHTKCFEQVTR
jgi:hypothetical protein